jgi:hypothetical protein
MAFLTPLPEYPELHHGLTRILSETVPITLGRRIIRILAYLLLLPPVVAAVAGWMAAPTFLHPIRRALTPDLIREADASFAHAGGHREDFNVRAPDGILLRGWIVRPDHPNGNWVLLFHGVADNRVGVVSHSEFLLHAGYSVVMMDARAPALAMDRWPLMAGPSAMTPRPSSTL